MEQYNMTKGIRGLRRLLRQFNEATLKPWQRDVLRERILILDWYDHNGKNKAKTARAFETSRSHVQKAGEGQKGRRTGWSYSENNRTQ
ncbi:hypothetical protein IPG41_06165 [Candidatus Peregrinibacteria bacterium]|nr:MAG: hypothetical protein IPG41_06165 [Candidatus Peregrinibacteria bacterium]